MVGNCFLFWQLGKLDKYGGNMKGMGKCVGMWGGDKRRCGKMCWGSSWEVCLGCRKCVWGVGSVLGEVWREWESMGRCGGGVWKCVWGVGRCGKVCLGVRRGVGNVLV